MNFGLRLDEIFAPLIDSPSLTLTTTYWGGAKQAITSLIKELVAEANLQNEDQDRLLKMLENENGIGSTS